MLKPGKNCSKQTSVNHNCGSELLHHCNIAPSLKHLWMLDVVPFLASVLLELQRFKAAWSNLCFYDHLGFCVLWFPCQTSASYFLFFKYFCRLVLVFFLFIKFILKDLVRNWIEPNVQNIKTLKTWVCFQWVRHTREEFISQEFRLWRRWKHMNTCKCKVFSIAVHYIFVSDWLFAGLGLCACVHHVLVLPPQGLMGVCPKAWGGGDSGRCNMKTWKTGAFVWLAGWSGEVRSG